MKLNSKWGKHFRKLKIWVEKGGEFHNRAIKKSLEENNIEMPSTENQRKSMSERFIRASNNQIYINEAAAGKNAYFDKLDITRFQTKMVLFIVQ